MEIEEEPPTITDLYNQLLRFYSTLSSVPRRLLENKIEDLMKKGLDREEAIKELAIKEKIIGPKEEISQESLESDRQN